MRKNYLLAVLFLLGPWSGLRAQTFDLNKDRQPVASLDGLWRFHTGDNPAWASPNFDDSQWPLLRSDKPWTAQGYPNYGGYAWYRFTIQVPHDSQPLGLLLPRIYTGYQLFANGELIGGKGSTSPTRDPILADPEIFRLASGARPSTIQIALRVWNYKPGASWYGGGLAEPGSAVGGFPLLLHRLDRDQNTSAMAWVNVYATALLATVVGLTIFGLFLFRPEDREYLWFAVILLAGAANLALHLAASFIPIPFPLVDLLSGVAGSWLIVATLPFFSIVLHVRRSILWWMAAIVAVASPLTVALYYVQWTTIGTSNVIQLACLLPAYVWVIFTLAICAFRKDTNAQLLLVPCTLEFGLNILDSILAASWELGWQRKWESLDISFLRRPFPLHPWDVVNDLFTLSLLIFLVRRFSLARQEEARLSTEMEAARTMQSLLVPATAPSTPGFTVESVYLPASEVGGDFFQILPGEDGSLLIVVGDVSGKGLKAAMTVSTLVGALRNETSRQPAEVLAHLNRVLHGQVSGFVTCSAALIAADGAMTLANAGHLSPYRNGEELAVESGLPLGILAEGSYEETHYQLALSDRLTFVSDGVVEATNDKRELFGFERTRAISTQPAQSIAEAAKQFGQEDDISVLSVTRIATMKATIV